MALNKIVSGGQTGVDRGALDASLVAGFACGGWCPADRRAEDGPIPDRYPMMLLPEPDIDVRTARQVAEQYKARTLKNVQDSDGTVILFSGTLSGGTLLTRNVCVREKRPLIVVDSKLMRPLRAADAIVQFVDDNRIEVLNVAGPRLSGWSQGYAFALKVVAELIARCQVQPDNE
jgi:hypothetical protein